MSSTHKAALKEQSKANVEEDKRDDEENAPVVSEAEEEAKEVEKEQIKDKLVALRAAHLAALQSIRLRQEREKQAAAAAEEDASDTASSVAAEEESVPVDVAEEDPLDAFPVPAGTDPAATWPDRVGDIVNTSEETEGVEASTYRFDGMPDDDQVDGLAALKVANKGTLAPPEMYEWLSEVERPVPDPTVVADKRRHAPWPGEIAFCKKMVKGIAHDSNVECRYPLPAGAHKEDFYVRQMDPAQNRGIPRAFQLPVAKLCGAKNACIKSGPVVVLSATLGAVTNTLGVELKTTLAQPALGARYPQIGEFTEDEGTTLHAISEENLALFNSPEFRRWSGVDAAAEKEKLRQFTSESEPIHEHNIDPSDTEGMSDEDKAGMKEYVDVPLVNSPLDLAQFLVLSHAAELRVASANLGKMIHLGLTFKATDDYKATDEYHGHVCVSFAALDLVIDYYTAKYHPSQFVTDVRGLALMMTPVHERGWTDLREMVDGEHAAKAKDNWLPPVALNATMEVTFMPYIGPIIQDNAITPYIEKWDALVRDALRDAPAHKAFRRQVIAAGLEDATDPSRFMCFVTTAHAKMMERDRAAWADVYTGPLDAPRVAAEPDVAYTKKELDNLLAKFDAQRLDGPEQEQLSRAQATLKDAKHLMAQLVTGNYKSQMKAEPSPSQARVALGAGGRPSRGLTEDEAHF